MSKPINHILIWVGIYIIYTIMLSFNTDPVSMMLLNLVQVLYRGCVIYILDGRRGFTKQLYYEPFADYLVKVIRFYSPAMALLALESHFKGKNEKKRILQLEKEKLSTELKYLKAQINPNFLFNTLNELYTHVQNESPQAPDMILKLSGILDYVLYQSQNSNVQLENEVESIKNFIDLEKIRYGENLDVLLEVTGDLSIPFSPLVLFSVVENAFKQNHINQMNPSKIEIKILEKNHKLHCKIVTYKNDNIGTSTYTNEDTAGSLAIKRQLDLVYPDKHDLIIQDLPNSLNVSLTINLN